MEVVAEGYLWNIIGWEKKGNQAEFQFNAIVT